MTLMPGRGLEAQGTLERGGRGGGLGERQQGNVPGEHTRGREAGRPS